MSEEKKISERELIERGFNKNYENHEQGFYSLDRIDDNFHFTVDMKTMTVAIQLYKWGHIKRLEHIVTIDDFDNLFLALIGRNITDR
jgi:hypothetical protein